MDQLSFNQEQLWFLDELTPGTPMYNIAVLYRLDGLLDAVALRQAIERVVHNHDILRARFGAAHGVPYQTIAPAEPVALPTEAFETEQLALRAAADEAAVPFDLSTGPLYRFRLFGFADDTHLLSIVVHHIVSDGWSIGLIANEISLAYAAIVRGESPNRTPGPQYSQYVDDQRRRDAGGQYDAQLDYWAKQLAGPPVLELPTDRPRPALAGHRGDTFVFRYPPELHAGAVALARRGNVSLPMLLTAVFGYILGRYTGEDDVLIGTTALGRPEPELESVVGLFVNMVALRLDLSDDPSFSQLLNRVRDTMLDAFDNQAVPFEKVVDHLQVARDPSRNPLFQACIQVLDEHTSGEALSLPGIAVSAIDQRGRWSRFDLSLTFVESSTDLSLSVEYSTELFDRWRIEQLARHIERVLDAVLDEPEAPLSTVDLLSPAERNLLLDAGYGPHDQLRSEPVHVLVAERAMAAPDAVAVVFEGAELTYGELDWRADRLARWLRTHGVGHEDLVGVAMERGLEVLVAFLGVLKAGGAFVVLDTEHPVNRLEFILDDSGADVVLTTADKIGNLPAAGDRTYVCLDRDWPAIDASGGTCPLSELSTRDSLVYALYTSGSTGKPKGVLIEHRALVSYLTSFVDMFDLGPGDRMLQFASIAFDLSQAEIFSALISGATLVFGRRDTLLSPDALSALMREERVTYIGAPPAMLAMLEPEPYPHLRNVLVGGEACPAELVNRWNLPGRKFVNGYGPTEATIGATMFAAPRIVWRSSPPIGGPLQHRRLYVVDRRGFLAPIGVPGELLIGGDEGLARGYLNRPDLDDARFIRDPFWPAGRVYRSGDLVRWTPDLQLEFLGRVDTQVKLRGLRIELEEIEAVLTTHPAVGQAAVALREDATGQQALAAYITVATAEPPSTAELRAHLAEHVPAYMVPAAWTVLDALPLSVAGKVNRLALPAPASFVDTERDIVTPQTPAQRHVAAAFAEILDLPADRVSVDDDFFELGGNSLQAMRVISRLNRAFSLELGVRALYGSPRLRDIAEQLTGLSTIDPSEPRELPHAVPKPVSLVDQIASIFAEVLPTPPDRTIGTHDNLFDLGADARQAAAAIELIGQRLGTPVAERDLYTVGVLAAAVHTRQATGRESASDTRRSSPLVPLFTATTPAAPPLFCVPGASGSAYQYVNLARWLRVERSIYGLEAPGLEPGPHPLDRVEHLAENFVRSVRARQPHGPYYLLGWSMGGLVAFDMARQLTTANEEVAFLAVVDTQLPDGDSIPTDNELIERFVQDLAAAAGLPAPDVGAMLDDEREPDRFNRVFQLLQADILPKEISPDRVRRQLAVFRANSHATYTYRPSWTYSGRLDVLRTATAPTQAAQWNPLAAEAVEHRVPGDHHTMWNPEHLPTLATIITNTLNLEGKRQPTP